MALPLAGGVTVVGAQTGHDGLERLITRLDRASWPARYALAVLITALVTAGLELSGLGLEPANISLTYLLGVLAVATLAGVGPSIAASVLSFLAYNYYFVEPLYILTVANPQDVVRLIAFLIAALLSSNLTGLLRRRTAQIQRRAAELEALYTLSHVTGAEIKLSRVLPEVTAAAVALLEVASCTLTVRTPGGERSFATTAPNAPADSPGIASAPVRVGERAMGTLYVLPRPNQRLDADERRLLELLASQAALAIERDRLAGEAAERGVLAAADRFKSALLSSVSHDLRTPLVAITGIATALQQREVSWDSERGAQMLATLAEEARHLNRLVGNLLDMSRIESGALEPARDWEDMGDLIGGVLARLWPLLAGRQVHVEQPADLPLVWVNAALIDQVLTNLLENSLKYTPAGTPLAIAATGHDDELWVQVIDHGPGVPAALLPHLFGKFVRGVAPERHAEGTGLGLAICKGIAEAHGGRIWAENQPGGGAAFTLALPLDVAGAPPRPNVDDVLFEPPQGGA